MNTRVKGLKISQIPELKELTGDEMIPYQYKCTNGKISTDTLKKYIEVNAGATDLTEVNNQIAELTKTTETLNESKQDKGDYALKSDIPNVDDFVTNNDLDGKQDTLVSGENIKTINGISILGEGDILTVENDFGDSTENPASLALITDVNKEVSNLSVAINSVNTEINTLSTSIAAIADEEDLTLNNNTPSTNNIKQLKFADKIYNPAEFSGIGRVYLRKNIVNGKNILSQNMMGKANTRYIIQYDYDLDGGEITIPEGCILDFLGGSITNGTLNLNCVFILGENINIDCNLYGKIGNRNVYASWFHKNPQIGTYESGFVEKIIAIMSKGTITFDGYNYEVSPTAINSELTIDLNGSEFKSTQSTEPMFYSSNANGIKISNGTIDGNYENTSGNNSGGIRFINCSNFSIENIFFKNVRRVCIVCWEGCKNFSIKNVKAELCGLENSISTLCETYKCSNFEINNISFSNSYGVGMYIHDSNKFRINNAEFYDILTDNGFTAESCYDFIISNIVTNNNANQGIEINACNKFKLINATSESNGAHNVFISIFTNNGYFQSYQGFIDNLTTNGATGDNNGLKITSGYQISVNNSNINDNIFITKDQYDSKLISFTNVVSPLLNAINTEDIALINCTIDNIIGNSNPTVIPDINRNKDKLIDIYHNCTIAVGDTFQITIPGTGNVATASGTIDLLCYFSQSPSQNNKSFISFKMMNNTLNIDKISNIPGDISRELSITNENNNIVFTNNTNIDLKCLFHFVCAYI